MSRIRIEEFIKQLDRKLGNYTAAETGKYSNLYFPYNKLFSPVAFGGITLKNRVMQECADDALAAVCGGAGLVLMPINSDRSLDAMTFRRKLLEEAHKRKAYIFAEVIAEQDRSSPIAAMLESGAMLSEMQSFAEEAVFQNWDGIYFIDRMEDDFGMKLLRKIRGVIDADMPVIYRISISSKRSIAETADYMQALSDAGVDMFVTDYSFEKRMQSITMPAACYTDISAYFKEYFAAINVEVPIAAVGRLEYPDTAEKALADNKCDLVLIENADADWCSKAASGKCAEIISPYSSGLSRDMLSKAEKIKKIAVSGSGTESLCFSLFAAARGHHVEIFESTDKIGGRLNTESANLEMYELRNYAERLKAEVRQCENIVIRTGTRALPELIEKEGFDTLVYGLAPDFVTKLNIPGWGEIPSVSVHDVMANPQIISGSKHITVLGNDDLALVCARFISHELGFKRVNVFSAAPAGEDRLRHYLEKNGAKLIFNATASKIVNGSVFADIDDGEKTDVKSFRTDLIVLALDDSSDINSIIAHQVEYSDVETHSFGPYDTPAEAEIIAFRLAEMI